MEHHDVWGSDWFPRALGGFLARDDALRLAVCVSVARDACLLRHLVRLHGPLAPISARDLVVCAAGEGDWAALAALQRRCRPSSQHQRIAQRVRRLGDAIRAIEATGAAVSPALRTAMWLQRTHPVRFPGDVLYSAAQRGRLEEIMWLVDVVAEFDPQRAIESAARGGHARAVQWLLDWITARDAADDRRESDQADEEKHKQVAGDDERVFFCEIRLDDQLLEDIGVITWREGPRNVAYCYVDGHGLLPRHRELGWARGYPLMDWAAAQGELALLQRLAEHPVASRSLSATSFQLAASHGHLHVVQWLWHHNQQVMATSLTRAMAEAAMRGDMTMLEWVHGIASDAETLGSLTSVFEAACASGHLQVVQWLFHHCLDERIRPRYVLMTAAGAGHEDVVKYLHEEQDYTVVGSTVAQAVAHGHLEAARYLYTRYSTRLSDGEKTMLVPMAVKSGKLAVVKWLVEEESLWSDQALENAAWAVGDEAVKVLQFLWERDEAQLRRSLASVSFVRLITRGKADVAQWIMEHVDESESAPPAASDVAWFSALLQPQDRDLRSHRTTSQTPSLRNVSHSTSFDTTRIVDVVIRCRPSFARMVKRLPLWAAVNGGLRMLQRLEAIGHPRLLADVVLDTIINGTRDLATMIWITQRRLLSPKQTTRIIRWAAEYCMLSVLQPLLAAFDSDPASRFIALRSAAWHGMRCGHSEVIQLVRHHIQGSGDVSIQDVSKVWKGIMESAGPV